MKASVAAAAIAILPVVLIGAASSQAVAQSSPSRERSYDEYRDRRDHRPHRHYTQRERDRLPIRITRPPGTGHYIYDDYPEWAARAFQPNLSR